MKVLNLNKQVALGVKVYQTKCFFQRLKGLIGTNKLEEGEGLLITPCTSIHTFFMKYPIDVIYFDDENIILHILHSIQPYSFSPIIKKAKGVLELPAGTCISTGSVVGDKIELVYGEE
ncbi:MAG: DUF192 domain-containing protein [Tepidanaerobacteraceae bacterium]|jgi:uncharacterized membrane protein (UPF0127 family)|nr:DUF192 domain-containing protein [Thermoanaerobacterales bacterium]